MQTRPPRVVISVGAKFHAFHLARELERRGLLAKIITGFPRLALKAERQWIHPRRLASLGEPQLALWGLQKFGLEVPDAGYRQARLFDWRASRSLPDCDIVVTWSGYGLNTLRAARARGFRTVLKRGSSHIQAQEAILIEEFARWGYRAEAVDPRMRQRELEEYAAADRITVPSAFAQQSFLKRGFRAEQVWVTPDGVDLDYFCPAAIRRPPTRELQVLFAGGISLRKGVQYLMEAARCLGPSVPMKIVWAGGLMEGGRECLERYSGEYDYRGFVSQAALLELYRQSDVLVLPSVEEGFGVVIAEAMACGLPVIASLNSAGPDLIGDEVDGFVVPARDVEALADRLRRLWQNPDLRDHMGTEARRGIGRFTWEHQADIYTELFRRMLEVA
jgi:glycosyltransferase involved in cell wall biosynthesis